MKKVFIVLLTGILFTTAGCKKKEKNDEPVNETLFEVYDETGNKMDNNHEFVYNTVNQSAQLNLVIKNISGETLHMKTKLESVSGTDGSMMEFCFGNCYVGMQTGTAYPLNTTLDVNAGQSTNPNDVHYWNHYNGGDATYHFSIFAVDNAGNVKGSVFKFTYKYQQ